MLASTTTPSTFSGAIEGGTMLAGSVITRAVVSVLLSLVLGLAAASPAAASGFPSAAQSAVTVQSNPAPIPTADSVEGDPASVTAVESDGTSTVFVMIAGLLILLASIVLVVRAGSTQRVEGE